MLRHRSGQQSSLANLTPIYFALARQGLESQEVVIVSILKKLANAFGKRRADRNNVSDEAYIPGDKDSIHIYSNVLAKCDEQTDAHKVMGALLQLTRLWSGEQKDKALFMAIVPETYPHLEKTADAKYMSLADVPVT